MELTEKDVLDILELPVGELNPTRMICEQCGYFDGPMHQMIHCAKCGGKFVSVAKWTIRNLLVRVNDHCNAENWIWSYVARWLEIKKQISPDIVYRMVAKHDQFFKDVYRKSNGNEGAARRLLLQYPTLSVTLDA